MDQPPLQNTAPLPPPVTPLAGLAGAATRGSNEGSGVHPRRSLADAKELARQHASTQMFGITDQGCVRSLNQDQFLIADLERSMLVQQASFEDQRGTALLDLPQGRLLMVADGMGGYTGGEVASAVAIDVMARYAFAMMPWLLMVSRTTEQEFVAGLQHALQSCNDRVRSEAAQRGLDARMGTTLTMAYVSWPDLYVAHVGDSRCYLQRAGQLHRLTHDHTVAQQLVDQNALSAEEAEHSRFKHVLVNTIGGASEKVEMEFRHISLEPGDQVLLCTDGLTGHVSDADLTHYLSRGEAVERLANEMVEQAKHAGGEDNITVVIARF
ncbi:MAG TPA: protein phosphatase 2C domain-containing protein [Polyangiales bacterium]|nr:protein phosphatase 2C domain-containing protein [Polyangiales bacterium]